MKKIILSDPRKDSGIIDFYDVKHQSPVFAKRKDKLVGMVIQDQTKGKWILKIGGSSGATGYHETLRDCLESCVPYDYEFFVN